MRCVLVSFFREQKSWVAITEQEVFSEFAMNRLDRVADSLQTRPTSAPAPGPRVAEPQRRQDVQRCGLRPAVVAADLNQELFRRLLGVFDEYIEVTILVKDTGVEQFILEFIAVAVAAGVNEI